MKYLEKERMFLWRRKKTEKEKEEKIMEREKLLRTDGWSIEGSITGPCGPKKNEDEDIRVAKKHTDIWVTRP